MCEQDLGDEKRTRKGIVEKIERKIRKETDDDEGKCELLEKKI